MSTSSVSKLPDRLAEEMTIRGIWKEGCPVPLDRLSLVTVTYLDFDGTIHKDGELIVLDAAAEQMALAFAEIYAKGFPIHKARSAHHYDGDDDLSMGDNNTYCFSHRPIEGSSTESLHSYGLALDINPLQNPFLNFRDSGESARITPQGGWEYVNRNNPKPGMVEEIVPVMAQHGFFIWGGRWTAPIDYHHFQVPRGMAELLTVMDKEDGKRFFDICIAYQTALASMPAGEKLEPLLQLYKNDPVTFFERFRDRYA